MFPIEIFCSVILLSMTFTVSQQVYSRIILYDSKSPIYFEFVFLPFNCKFQDTTQIPPGSTWEEYDRPEYGGKIEIIRRLNFF